MKIEVDLPDDLYVSLQWIRGSKAIIWKAYAQDPKSHYLQGRDGFSPQEAVDKAVEAVRSSLAAFAAQKPQDAYADLTVDDLDL